MVHSTRLKGKQALELFAGTIIPYLIEVLLANKVTGALALKRALMIVIDLGLDKVKFDSDCLLPNQCAVNKQARIHEWCCKGVIQEIKDVLSPKAFFVLLPRS